MNIDTTRTAGLTSVEAVEKLGNRYDLILVASTRVRELHRGHRAKIATKHGAVITALQEIEQGLVGIDYLLRDGSYGRKQNKQK